VGRDCKHPQGGQGVRDVLQIMLYYPFFWVTVLRVWRRACLRGGAIRLNICSHNHNLGPPLPALLLRSSPPPLPHTMPPSDPAMPPANADLATTWAYLEEGVDHIMNRLREGGSTGTIPSYPLSISNSPSRVLGVSYSKYMNLYTVAYNYCVSSRMHGNIDASVGLGGRSTSLFYSLFSPCQTTARLTRSLSCSSRRQLDGL